MDLSIGIDWSDQRHAVCIREIDTRRVLAEFVIEHSAAGVEHLEEKINALGGTPARCGVAIETNQGMLVNYLLEMGYHIHPIPPAAVKTYRDRRRRSGAKSDVDDAQLLADILCQDRGLYPPLLTDSSLARELRAIYRGRGQLARHRTQVINQLKHNLKSYFPAAIGLFSRLDSQIAQAFLTAFPTQQGLEVRSVSPAAIWTSNPGHSCPCGRSGTFLPASGGA